MKGRRPIPSTVHALRGNPGKRPLNPEEPRPPAEIPPCPRELGAVARKEWRRISKELLAVGLVTKIDRAALMAYCVAWERWLEASEKLRVEGLVTMVTTKEKTTYPIQNPYLSIANTALAQMRSFLIEFGMTPASRSKTRSSPIIPKLVGAGGRKAAAAASVDPWEGLAADGG